MSNNFNFTEVYYVWSHDENTHRDIVFKEGHQERIQNIEFTEGTIATFECYDINRKQHLVYATKDKQAWRGNLYDNVTGTSVFITIDDIYYNSYSESESEYESESESEAEEESSEYEEQDSDCESVEEDNIDLDPDYIYESDEDDFDDDFDEEDSDSDDETVEEPKDYDDGYPLVYVDEYECEEPEKPIINRIKDVTPIRKAALKAFNPGFYAEDSDEETRSNKTPIVNRLQSIRKSTLKMVVVESDSESEEEEKTNKKPIVNKLKDVTPARKATLKFRCAGAYKY